MANSKKKLPKKIKKVADIDDHDEEAVAPVKGKKKMPWSSQKPLPKKGKKK